MRLLFNLFNDIPTLLYLNLFVSSMHQFLAQVKRIRWPSHLTADHIYNLSDVR